MAPFATLALGLWLRPPAMMARSATPLLSEAQHVVIRCRNVPFDATAADVHKEVESHMADGSIKHVWLASWGRAGQSRHRGFGRITFSSAASADAALRLGSFQLLGRSVMLEEDQKSEPPRSHKRQRPIIEAETVEAARHELAHSRRNPKREPMAADLRGRLLQALEQSRFRDYASAQAYRRAVAEAMQQLGRLESPEEITILVGAAGRARDPQCCLRLLRRSTTLQVAMPVAAYDAAVSACVGPALWRTALEVLDMVPSHGGMPAVSTYCLAARACAKARRLEEATRLLHAIDMHRLEQGSRGAAQRSVLTAHQATLEAAARCGRWREACALMTRLRTDQGVRPNVACYLGALSACANLDTDSGSGDRVGAWRRADVYSSGDATERCEAARGLLAQLESDHIAARGAPDTPHDVALSRCYDAALRACALQSDPSHGSAVLRSMRSVGLQPSAVSYATAISGCRGSGDDTDGAVAVGWQSALALMAEMANDGVQPDTVVYGAAIAACASAGRWEEAAALLSRMESEGLAPDAFCYSSCIAAFGRGDHCDDALSLLATLERGEGAVAPTTIVYNAAISACERAGRWKDATRLLDTMSLKGQPSCAPNVVSLNAAISACEKGGQWRRALQLLSDGAGAAKRDAASYAAAMKSAVSLSGGMAGERAVSLIRSAEAAGFEADAATYNAAISALEQASEWQMALDLYEEMQLKGIEPTVVTYGALMQALAVAGQVSKGFEVLRHFEDAGLANTSKSYSLHRTLLQACRTNGTSAQVEYVREAMARRGLSAVAPVAKATVGGEVRRWSNQMSRMPGTAQTAAKELWGRAKRSGLYKPDFSALPYAFTRRARRASMERSLQGHAEKLALAELLSRRRSSCGGKGSGVGATKMMTEATNVEEGDDPVELSINFKVCADCHRYFKAVSAMMGDGREIIVREPKLTHTFRAGVCSCGDRWRWEARTDALANEAGGDLHLSETQ